MADLKAMTNALSIGSVFRAIRRERAHQGQKYGTPRAQSLPGFILIMERELEEAKLAWVKGGEGRNSAMAEVLQVAAVAVAACEKYGVEGCPVPTDDLPVQCAGVDEPSRLADKVETELRRIAPSPCPNCMSGMLHAHRGKRVCDTCNGEFVRREQPEAP